jgi:hypothetical protein
MRPLAVRLLSALAFALLLIGLGTVPSYAEKRVALVIGNDSYPRLPADQQLQKAVNDSRAVGDALGKLGFEVIRGENLGRQAMVDKLDMLAGKLSPGDTAFFFFAGHGVAINGGNYIIPSDVPAVETGQETRLARTAFSESDIVSDLQQRGARVVVIVLDACRDNPFRRPGLRSVGGERGFARVEPVSGVFTLYSAGLGQTALDRLNDADDHPNSVFTRVLVPKLTKPGTDLTAMAKDVREEVARLAGTVGHDQRPAYYDETIGNVYLAGLPAAPQQMTAVQPAPARTPAADPAAQAWNAVKDTTSVAVLEDFVGRYGDTIYGTLAKERLNQVAVVPPAKQNDDSMPINDPLLLNEMRERLFELNFDPGPLDGPLSDAARQAIKEFEQQANLPLTDAPTMGLLRRLRESRGLKPWGAIVYGKESGKWGMAWGESTRKAAVAAARASCGDPRACPVEVSFFGTECGAFAYSGTDWAMTARDNTVKAKQAALADCGKRGNFCKVIASVCADGSERFSAK